MSNVPTLRASPNWVDPPKEMRPVSDKLKNYLLGPDLISMYSDRPAQYSSDLYQHQYRYRSQPDRDQSSRDEQLRIRNRSVNLMTREEGGS